MSEDKKSDIYGLLGRLDATAERMRLPPQFAALDRLPVTKLNQLPLFKTMETLSALMRSTLQPYHEAMQSFGRAMEPMRERFALLATEGKKSRKLEAAGWLPHSTAPFDQLEEDLEPAAVSAIIERHYRGEWPRISRAFLADLEEYDVDEEAKAVFREALELHGMGYHRAVCRLLFPEIERVARVEIDEGALHGTTSQKKLKAKIAALTPSEMGDGLRGFAVFKKFVDHVYASVMNETALMTALSDPVPNRHIALHGLGTYASFQHSLNALIVCDFVFRGITAIKRYADEDDESAA